MALSLTEEQKRVVLIAESGHNLLLTGKAGTGKSTVVNTIVRKLKAAGKKVIVVCSSGISCTVYDDFVVASTVHSHYALQTADMPWNMVVERAIAMEHAVFRIQTADVLIWDECGMGSRRTFELGNQIEHQVASEGDKSKPFGGKQIILVGDFLQLRPVPNLFDAGQFMFESPLFRLAITRRFKLTCNMRQDQASVRFVGALEELRLGRCSEPTELYLRSLSRSIEGSPVYIYFRKLEVELHNISVLQSMPGNLISIDCVDSGNTEGISCPAPVKLQLKADAKVMLVWNLNDKMKNGSTGTFLRKVNDKLQVKIAGKDIMLEPQTWHKRNKRGEVVGSRTQYPLTLFYATTCHKVQGQTLDGAVVQCCKEFVPSLIYVAVSRVKHEDRIQLLNFNKNQLLPPSEEVLSVCSNKTEAELNNCKCCNQKGLPEDMFKVCDRGEAICEDRGAPEALADDAAPDGLVLSFFEHDNDEVIVDLAEFYGTLETHDEFSSLPDNIDALELISQELVPVPKSDFARDKNNLIKTSIENAEFKARLVLFSRIQWYKIYLLFRKYIEAQDLNQDSLHMTRKNFHDATNQLYVDILCSAEFVREVKALFDVGNILPIHRSVASSLGNTLYALYVQRLAEKLVHQHQNEAITLDLKQMPVEGLAKIRHVGGWAVRKELEHRRRYVRTNMYSTSECTQKKVKDCHFQCKLLEEHVIERFEVLRQTSVYSGTLCVTEDRQYRERGLIHISDQCFLFFRRLEEVRIPLMNHTRLQQTVNKEQFVDKAIACMRNDDELSLLWDDMFMELDANEHEQAQVNSLGSDIITRYMKMASCQFLRDFRRAFNLQKSSEHRKKVLQRQQVAAVKTDCVPYVDIANDKSQGKVASHHKLAEFVVKHKSDGLQKAYKKQELTTICKAYGIPVTTRDNMKKMSGALAEKLPTQQAIPQPWHFWQPVSSYTEVNAERVVLRISMSNQAPRPQ